MRAHEIMQLGMAAVCEDGGSTIKPQKPLNAEQLRRHSEKQARTQKQMRDEQSRHASKTQDLQARLV